MVLFHGVPRDLRERSPFGRASRIALLTLLAVYGVSIFWFMPSFHSPSVVPLNPINTYVSKPTEPVVEVQGVVIGESFDKIVARSPANQTVGRLSDALFKRYVKAITNDEGEKRFNLGRNRCPTLNLSRYDSSSILVPREDRATNNEPLTIAINLHDSAGILPSLSTALMELVHQLGPSRRIYISIFENGSWDETCNMLGDLASALLALKVDGIIFRCSMLKRPDEAERIMALANIRNEALFPLLPYAGNGTLLFINDIVTCGFDLIELVHQLHLQNAHVAMGTDWTVPERGEDDDGARTTADFYDKWVARGLSGEMAVPFVSDIGTAWSRMDKATWPEALFSNEDNATYQRWLDGRPIPVYSGWNGALAAQANIFTEYKVRFRAGGTGGWRGGASNGVMGQWGELIATPGYLDSDCTASECKLFARDVWNLKGGRARFALAAQAKSSYDIHDWDRMMDDNFVPPTVRTDAEGLDQELIDWSDVKAPESVVCIPILNDEGKDEMPWLHRQQHLKPLLKAYQDRHFINTDKV